jgi:2-isopropylmalate synthase
VQALQTAGIELNVRSFEERSRSASSHGGNAEACAFVEVSAAGESQSRYGVAVHANIITASIQALVSAANRVTQQQRQQVAA